MARMAFIILPLLLSTTTYAQQLISATTIKEIRQQAEENLKQARETKGHLELADAYFKLAEIEKIYGPKKENVLDYYDRAKEYYKLNNSLEQYHKTNIAMALEYYQSSMPDLAKELLNETLKGCKQSNCNQLINQAQLLAARIGLYEGDFLAFEQNFAMTNPHNLTTSNEIIDYTLLEAKANVFQSKFQEAIDSMSNYISSPSISNIYPAMIESRLILAEAYSRSGDQISALNTLNEVEPIVSSLPLNFYNLQLLTQKSQTLSKLKKSQDALAYTEKLIDLKDSLSDRNRLETISNISEKYKTKQKNTEIRILELEKQYINQRNDQQRRGIYVLGIFIGILGLLIYFTVRFYSQQMSANEIISQQNTQLSRQKIQTLEDEIKLKGMRSMIDGQESERERISKDLHDSLGGLLSTIKLQLEHIPINKDNTVGQDTKRNVEELLDLAVKEVRSISSNLQPVSLKNLGLIAALKDLINRYTGPGNPSIEFLEYNIPKIDNMKALSIYRITQELLNNTIKHAQASEVFIQLRYDGESNLVLQYEDDGKGFDMATLKDKGMGLENITSRVDYLKGEVSIDARPGAGVSYILDIPLQKEDIIA